MNIDQLPAAMVSAAGNRSLSEVLDAIVTGLAQCKKVVLARIWLTGPGDACSSCRFKAECPDQSRCLHLSASAGNPRSGSQNHRRLDGSFKRFPLGVRKIGRVGKSGESLLIPDVRGNEEWVAVPEWIRAQKVRTFAAHPLIFRGEVLGVLALFDAGHLTRQDFSWLRVFADHAAVSIANARAFEEIETLRKRLEQENSYLREEVTAVLGTGSLIGTSPGLRKVLEQIQLVAATDATVLITGESGTGKELVARAIHEASNRKQRALVKVNCGAVPETLFESEFFGHARGSFTGAMRDKPGKFELADGGSLFLDEIGEVPLNMQSKLLRVLQEQEVERIGEARTRRLNVRILTATNRDLKVECERHHFRHDLFYRLSVFPIEIPPLRERREDIVPLARHFLEQASRRMNRQPPRLTQSTLEQLTGYSWPGNVRELQNAVERAVILAQNGPLRFDLSKSPSPAQRPEAPTARAERTLITREQLKRLERESIREALDRAEGRLFGPDGAAELLGMKPTTLASRIKALGLSKVR